jgi:hypothetical protein
MSQENVEVVREFYADPDPWGTFTARVAPDAEFDFTALYPDGPVLHGIDEARRFRDEVPWDMLHFEPERLIEVDEERVLALVRALGVGQLGGVSGEARVAHEFTIRAGLLIRFKVYGDQAEALEAAGPGE